MSFFGLILSNHSLLTAVQEMNKCAAHSLLFSGVLSSYFIHTLINSADGGSETYLWLKLFSFLRQCRVTILWPSLLTSWLTVHITGLLALAPRKATPSFSLTLKHTHTRAQVRKKDIKWNDNRNVIRTAHKLWFRNTCGLFYSLYLCLTNQHVKQKLN